MKDRQSSLASSKTTTKRKVIQIAAAPTGHSNDFAPLLYALCDNGTVWARRFDEVENQLVWRKITPIPQN